MKTVEIINGRRVAFSGRVGGKITMVRSSALWDAFTVSEQETLAAHTNSKVKAFLQTLGIHRSIRASRARAVLTALENGGILAAGRANEIADALR